MAQKKSQLPLMLGLVAAGGIGYYLYSAGGDPKVAEKNFESDLSKASAIVKTEMPGRTKEAQKQGEAWAADVGAKTDSAADKARVELAKGEGKFDQMRKEVGKEAMKSVDAFDRKVEEGAAKAKSGISSWFGGK